MKTPALERAFDGSTRRFKPEEQIRRDRPPTASHRDHGRGATTRSSHRGSSVAIGTRPGRVDSNKLGAYLSNLRQLRLIERDIPVTADPTSTRKSRYRLNEPLFRFWFRYVYGQSAKLQQLSADAYEELIAPSFTEYMGPMFERVCQLRLPSLLSKTFQGIGYW